MEHQKVWIHNHPTLLFGQGTLQGPSKKDPSLYEIQDDEGTTFKLKNSEFSKISSNIDCSSGDLLTLEDLNQQTLLHNVRKRFQSQKIYSSIGTPILIAVNPYKKYNIYDSYMKARFATATRENLSIITPHIFKTAEISFRNLLETGKSQNIIITGESGAGKTESTKFILDYIASREKKSLSASSSGERLEEDQAKMDTLEKRILLANPVLEAFGNAKTVRNDNSSRFGKYIEIYFGGASELQRRKLIIKGARINNYLLENSRIDGQAGNERNYHIFYNLLAKSKENLEFAQRYKLEFLKTYNCVNTLNENHDLWNAKKLEFENLMENFDALEFTKSEVYDIFRIISGIMNLSNIEIIAAKNNASDIQENDQFFEHCLELFGLSKKVLKNLICFKSIKDPMTQKFIEIPVSQDQAKINRNTVSKMIYSQMFDWLIFKVNMSISGNDIQSNDVKNTLFY